MLWDTWYLEEWRAEARQGTEMKTKARRTSKRAARVTEGSGNVFADLGLPNPEQELLKAQLTLQIYTILKDSGMTQVEIAKIRQPLRRDRERPCKTLGWRAGVY